LNRGNQHCTYSGMRKTDPELLQQSRVNKRQMNAAEAVLWTELRRAQMGVKFRRQHVVFGHLMDFACVSLKLDVESDGSQHRYSEVDRRRDRQLEAAGWTILRFWSWEIFEDKWMVIRTISRTVEELKAERSHGT
jgi:very-short-patch-repair endonuclease